MIAPLSIHSKTAGSKYIHGGELWMAGQLLLDPAEHLVAPPDELRARQLGPESQVACEIGAAAGQPCAA
jgi:hypothetical protein